MYPPKHICEGLARIHPQLRMAWAGRPPAYEDELNPGSFAIVQLYHISDVGRPGEEHTFKQPWDLDYVVDETGDLRTKRIDRGPIFAKDGSPTRDWDPLMRVPIFVCTVDDEYQDPVTGEPLCSEDVWSGKILDTARHWLMPIKDRMKKKYALLNQEISDEAEDTAAEMTDYLMWEANKSDSTSEAGQARKFYKEDRAAMERKAELNHENAKQVYRLPD